MPGHDLKYGGRHVINIDNDGLDDVDCPCHDNDRPDDIFYDVNTAADVVDHAALLNHHNGIRTDDQHDAEHRLHRAVNDYLTGARYKLDDADYLASVRAIHYAAGAVLEQRAARNR